MFSCFGVTGPCGERVYFRLSAAGDWVKKKGRTTQRSVVREMKENERERRVLLSYGVLVERGCPFLSFVPPCCVNCPEG